MKTFRPSLLMLAMLSAAAIHPADASEPRRMKVSYADLNLRTAAGAKRLYRRIDTAAASVCRDLESKELSGREVWRHCMSQAISDAVLEVDAPLLTAYYAAQQNDPQRVALDDER